METTETTEPIPAPAPAPLQVVLTEQAKYFLHTAGRWATFLGIMGFIGTGFIVLCALFVGTIFTAISRLNPAAAAIPMGGTGLITFMYLLIAVFYFFMSYYIYQFGANIKRGMALNDSLQATKAFEYLKSHLKLIGITTIVCISLELLVLIGVILVLIFAASALHQ